MNFLWSSLGIFSTENISSGCGVVGGTISAGLSIRWTRGQSGTALTSLEQWTVSSTATGEIRGIECQFSQLTHESSAELDRPSIPLPFTWSRLGIWITNNVCNLSCLLSQFNKQLAGSLTYSVGLGSFSQNKMLQKKIRAIKIPHLKIISGQISCWEYVERGGRGWLLPLVSAGSQLCVNNNDLPATSCLPTFSFLFHS